MCNFQANVCSKTERSDIFYDKNEILRRIVHLLTLQKAMGLILNMINVSNPVSRLSTVWG